MSRTLVCSGCGASIQVFEAALGASTDAEHRYLDPTTYVGGVCGCLKAKPLPDDSTPTEGMKALGRARTARERARNREEAV